MANTDGLWTRDVEVAKDRVVMLLFELCQEIWGGSPATHSIVSSIEAADLVESSSEPSTSTEKMSSSLISPAESLDCLPLAVVKQRRDLLQLGS